MPEPVVAPVEPVVPATVAPVETVETNATMAWRGGNRLLVLKRWKWMEIRDLRESFDEFLMIFDGEIFCTQLVVQSVCHFWNITWAQAP